LNFGWKRAKDEGQNVQRNMEVPDLDKIWTDTDTVDGSNPAPLGLYKCL